MREVEWYFVSIKCFDGLCPPITPWYIIYDMSKMAYLVGAQDRPVQVQKKCFIDAQQDSLPRSCVGKGDCRPDGYLFVPWCPIKTTYGDRACRYGQGEEVLAAKAGISSPVQEKQVAGIGSLCQLHESSQGIG